MAGVCSGPGPCDTSPTGHGGDNFVTRGGGFDPYLRAIINALKRSGHSESEAVQIAIGTVQRWARGGGNVTAATRARAAKSLAHWEALRAKAHALTAAPTTAVDLAEPVFATTDGPTLTVPVGTPGRRNRGWSRIDAGSPGSVDRATRAVTSDGHALLHGKGMVATAQRVAGRMRRRGHGVRVQRVQVAGKTHLHIRRTTR